MNETLTQANASVWRFEEKVFKEPNSGCWLWTGSLAGTYGKFWNGEKLEPAHRFSYRVHKGGIPKGLQLDHLCRTRSCVNPNHLEPVTPKENVRRGVHSERLRARRLGNIKSECPSGHKYEGDNLYVVPTTGVRQCRTCRKRHAAAFENKGRK